MEQASKTGGQQAAVLQLGAQELNGQGQPSGRQDLFVDIGNDVLSGEVAGDPLAEDAEEIDLLNVFFTVQNAGGHALMISLGLAAL